MRQSKLRYLFGGITLASMMALLLCASGILSPVSAQSSASPTATPTPPPTATPARISATATPQFPAALDSDSYETLLEHFEKVSSSVLVITKWVVAIVGVLVSVLGGASGFISIKGAREIQGLRNETDKLGTMISRFKSELEESRQLNMDATNTLRYFLEARESNYQVRARAAQKLGISNDIAAVSVLIGMLENDRSMHVKAEAAHGLGKLLSKGQEPGIFDEGIEALLSGTKDKKEEVRTEAVEALDFLVCENIELPRTVHRRMRELVEHDTIEDVVKAAKETLKHLKQQRERKLNSPGPENN